MASQNEEYTETSPLLHWLGAGKGKGRGSFSEYPKHVFLILGNEFCERFSFYGMKAILVLFLTRALMFSGNESSAIYHGFNVACYFMPIFGAIIADGFLGKYKTILYISLVYAAGNIIMAVGAVPMFNNNFHRALPFVGLTLIAIGTGGIKPCVSAFGADQFEDHQSKMKETFFSLFYMAINLGSLLSMVITPIIRSQVRCFGRECYALAFGIPAGLMIVAVVFFILGTKAYTQTPPGENIIGKLFGCIFTALKGKCSCSSSERREHWLDYADSKYDKRFVEDVKSVMRVLFMFLPLPVFWALFDQQGSRWLLQAELMNGELGNFVLQPDLIQVLNPLLVVVMVPLMESLLFPCLDKCKLPNSPLQRLGFGMFLAGTAFVITAFVQIGIDRTLPKAIAGDMGRFKVLNAAPCDISSKIMLHSDPKVLYEYKVSYSQRDNPAQLLYKDLKADQYNMNVTFTNCVGPQSLQPISMNFTLNKAKSHNVIVYWDASTNSSAATLVDQPELKKAGKGKSKFQFFNTWDEKLNVTVQTVENSIELGYLDKSDAMLVAYGSHEVKAIASGSTFSKGNFRSKAGAVYTIVFHYKDTRGDESSREATQYEDLEPNKMNILWQIPQYVVMSLGEVFFSVTGLSFAYSQAPTSMKAVLQSAWLLTNSFGNIITMIITGIGKLPNQMAEFLLFAGLMYVTVVIFAIMSMFYTYVEPQVDEAEDDNKLAQKEGIDNLAVVASDNPMPPKYDAVIAGDEGSNGPAVMETVRL